MCTRHTANVGDKPHLGSPEHVPPTPKAPLHFLHVLGAPEVLRQLSLGGKPTGWMHTAGDRAGLPRKPEAPVTSPIRAEGSAARRTHVPSFSLRASPRSHGPGTAPLPAAPKQQDTLSRWELEGSGRRGGTLRKGLSHTHTLHFSAQNRQAVREGHCRASTGQGVRSTGSSPSSVTENGVAGENAFPGFPWGSAPPSKNLGF